MSNNYPKVFNKVCNSQNTCYTINKCYHKNDKMSKDIAENKKLHELRERVIPNKVNLNSCYQNNICAGHKHENFTSLIDKSLVKYPTNISHKWSNLKNFGDLNIFTNDTCNNVHTKVYKYNL